MTEITKDSAEVNEWIQSAEEIKTDFYFTVQKLKP